MICPKRLRGTQSWIINKEVVAYLVSSTQARRVKIAPDNQETVEFSGHVFFLEPWRQKANLRIAIDNP
jgi:hypothetical protein